MAESDAGSDIRHAGVSNPLECYERCVQSRRDILQPNSCCSVHATAVSNAVSPTLVPTRSPAIRVAPWIEVALCGLSGRGGLSLGGKPWGVVRQRRVLSSVTVKRRKSWLLAASALASSSLGISGPALAQMRAVHVGGSVTCSPSRQPLSPPASASIPTTPPVHSHRPHASAGCQCHHPRRLTRG